MALVREDDRGIYIKVDGLVARPGPIIGYGHAYRMDDGGLKQGDKVKARHRGGTTLAILTLDDGTKRYWCDESEHKPGSIVEEDLEAQWKPDGTRLFGRS